MAPGRPGRGRADVLAVGSVTRPDRSSDAAPSPSPGRTFGPFRLIRLLGRGGAGSVWEADDGRTGRRVALKILTEVSPDTPGAKERFEREGRLAASLNHPSCVYIFGAEEAEGRAVISMELMRGGTLDDRLKEGGIDVEEAVDYVLDLVDGLEAAFRKGIVHRDVKPSNCFLDEDRTSAKIGDFGVSRLLETPSDLSRTGLFVGTPHYASPEQVRGEKVDVASDLYSLGALLYELLTGERPFSGEPLHVVANILTRKPSAPSSINPSVPRSLDRVVLRLLEKEKKKRYADYEALRAALLPYSSRGLEVAGVGKRVVAGLLDLLPLLLLELLLELAFRSPSLPYQAALASAGLVYFAGCEARWGRTPGKWVTGLHVTTGSGSEPSLSRTSLRAVVYWVLPEMAVLVHEALFLVAWLLLFSTMRRRNGFAGVHGMVSGTRVMRRGGRKARIEVENRPLVARGEADAAPAGFGPYRTAGVVWSTPDERLYTARDDRLERDVWIHGFTGAVNVPTVSEQARGRPGRLRWLQGERDGAGGWDAWGAPDGSAFRTLVEADGPLSWARLRPLLLDVARELRARAAEGRPMPPGIDHVWVDANGHAKVLDFPLPVPRPGSPGSLPRGDDTSPDLLSTTLRFGLTGEVGAPGSDPLQGIRVPEHARPVVEAVLGGGGSGPAIRGAVEALATSPEGPDAVSRGRRVAAFASMNVFPLLWLTWMTGSTLVYPIMPGTLEPGWAAEYAEAYTGLGDPPTTPALARRREALGMILADLHRRHVVGGQAPRLADLDDEVREVLAGAAAAHPSLDAERLRRSRDLVGPPAVLSMELALRSRDPESGGRVPGPWLAGGGGPRTWGVLGLTALRISSVWLMGLALLAPFAALGMKGGLTYSVLGIHLLDEGGYPAGRGRCLVRSLVAWAPALVLLAAARVVDDPGHELMLSGAALAIMAAGAAYAVYRPERGLPDLLAGTYAVPGGGGRPALP